MTTTSSFLCFLCIFFSERNLEIYIVFNNGKLTAAGHPQKYPVLENITSNSKTGACRWTKRFLVNMHACSKNASLSLCSIWLHPRLLVLRNHWNAVKGAKSVLKSTVIDITDALIDKFFYCYYCLRTRHFWYKNLKPMSCLNIYLLLLFNYSILIYYK